MSDPPPENATPRLRPSTLPRWAFAAALALPLLSPSVLSDDSATYAHAAVTGHDVVHPHHLAYAAWLRAWVLGARGLGLGDAPWIGLRAGAVAAAVAGLWALRGLCGTAGAGPVAAGWATLLAAASALYWQFSGQCEAYVPACGALAAAGWAALAGGAAGAAGVGREKGSWRSRGPLAMAAGALALATTMHQAAALAAGGIAVMVALGARRGGATPRGAAARGVAVATLAGFLSLGVHLAAWRASAPKGTGFVAWLTRYASESGHPDWGSPANVGARGLDLLSRSWGAAWWNATPFRFYDPLPEAGLWITQAWLAALVGAWLWLAARPSTRWHAAWTAAWIVPVELFTLWWTPWLKNFQALAFPPMIAIAAMAAGTAGRSARVHRTATAALAAVALAFAAGNFVAMTGPALSGNPPATAAAVSGFLRMAGRDDTAVAAWPHSQWIELSGGARRVVEVCEGGAPGGDGSDGVGRKSAVAWSEGANQAKARRRTVFHPSALFRTEPMLARPGGGTEAVLGDTLSVLESAAGGLDGLRGEVRIDRRGPGEAGVGGAGGGPRLAGLALGVDPELPLTAREAYAAVCVAAADSPTSAVEAEPLRKFLMARARAGAGAGVGVFAVTGGTTGTSTFAHDVPFVDSAGRAAWFGFGGATALGVGPTAPGGGLDFATVGTSATVRTKWKSGIDLSAARRMELDATLTLPAGAGAAGGSTTATLLVHFQDFEQPDSPSRNRALHLPWPADGAPRRASVDLADYPWLARARPTVGLALAPRGVPTGTRVTVTGLRFR